MKHVSFLYLSTIEKIAFIFAISYYICFPFLQKYLQVYPSLLYDKDAEYIAGEITSVPILINKNKYRIELKSEYVKNDSFCCSKKGNITVFIPYQDGRKLEEGLIIKAKGSFSLNEKNIFFAKKASIIGWKNTCMKHRGNARYTCKKILLQFQKAGPLLQALFTGSKDMLSEQEKTVFKNAGLSHVLALSGMHLSLIGGIIEFLCLFLIGKRKAENAKILVCLLYVWFAGTSPSLLRALLFVIISVLSNKMGIHVKLLSILSASFVIQIILQFSSGVEISFLLSYTSILGIGLFYKKSSIFLCKFLPAFLADSLAVSVSAFLGTLPISLIFFHSCIFIGIFASIIIVPLISVFFIFGLFSIIAVMCVPSSFMFMNIIMNKLYDIIFSTAHFFSLFPSISF